MTCPSCGAAAPEGARFCPSCGHPLQGRADERRVVTVVFADLVGFTTLSEGRDPEHVKNLVDRCFSRLGADVDAFGGQVDKIVGDALVALFGAPTAHEDDAERAVRAALQMQCTLAGMAEELGGEPPRLRVGVNTGEVLVGGIGGDYTAMGDVVNVASRLQTRSAPGDVVVGPGTYLATRSVICYEPLGPVQVKGRGEAVDAWQAVGTAAPPGHRPRRATTPLVGRDEELGVLCNGLSLALTRQRAHLALLLGEAGIGKTRLSEELATVAAEKHGARVLEGRCLPYGEANVWWPIADALRQACAISPSDDAVTTADKCRAAVAEALGLANDDAEVARVVEGLRYLMGDFEALLDVDPARARDEARWSLETYLEAAVARRPLVLVLSELHWADTLVLELVDHLLDRMRNLPFVLVGTARPELEERWMPAAGRFNQVVLHLDPLPADAARELLAHLLGDQPTPELRDLLLERSGGNPFFLEELVALLGDDGGVRPSELPATLRGLVSARLDALSPRERAVLEDAAVVGRSGRRETVVALAESRGDTSADALLDQLASKELLTLDTGPDAPFEFRSEMVREVAYETLTKAERARRHAAVAERFESRLRQTDREDEFLELLAHHYGMAAELVHELGRVDGVPADITNRALHAIERAAVRAKQRELPRLSLRLLDLALRLLPDKAHRHRRLVLLERAKAKTTLRDLPGARVDLEQGMELAEEAGDQCDLARGLIIRGEIEQKEEDLAASDRTFTEAIARLGELDPPQPQLLGEALRLRGMTRLFFGDPSAAEADIEAALAAARAAGARQQEAWALWSLAWNAFVQSRLGDAEQRLHEAHAVFKDIGDWGAVDWTYGLLGWVRYFQGRRAEAELLALKILGQARDVGDKWALAMTLVLLSSVRMWEGRTDEAIEPAREAAGLFAEIDDARGVMQASATLARTLAASGRVDEARQLLAERMAADTAEVAGEFQTGVMLSTSLLQFGDAEAALQALASQRVEANIGGDMGRSEGRSLIGLGLLQLGDAEQALEEIQNAADNAPADGPRANALALLGLARVCLGQSEAALAAASEVAPIEASTYADRSMAELVTGLANVQLGRFDEAADAFGRALSILDATGDRLMQATARLAAAEGLAAMEHTASAGLRDEAETRLAAMRIDAPGWRKVFRLAASARSPRPTA
jgi:class 3 adenylate cyclase/tetratricopeptide (TPR) repeat protein